MCSPLLGWESSGVEFRPAVAGVAETRATVESGPGLQGAVGAGRTRDRLAMRTHGGIVSAAHRRHVGSAYARWRARWVAVVLDCIRSHMRREARCQGGVAGGVPPHKGGPKARPSKRQWKVDSGKKLQGTDMARSLREVEGLVPPILGCTQAQVSVIRGIFPVFHNLQGPDVIGMRFQCTDQS